MRTVTLVASDTQNQHRVHDHTANKIGYWYRVNYFFFSLSDLEQSPSYEREKRTEYWNFDIVQQALPTNPTDLPVIIGDEQLSLVGTYDLYRAPVYVINESGTWN